jgi:hypothetical protein
LSTAFEHRYDARHTSDRLAELIAATLVARGVRVYVLRGDPGTQEYAPTPLLAYAVTALGCAAGVMVTASHNPKQYNGYKVYWSNGCQIIPPVDQRARPSVCYLPSRVDLIGCPAVPLAVRCGGVRHGCCCSHDAGLMTTLVPLLFRGARRNCGCDQSQPYAVGAAGMPGGPSAGVQPHVEDNAAILGRRGSPAATRVHRQRHRTAGGIHAAARRRAAVAASRVRYLRAADAARGGRPGTPPSSHIFIVPRTLGPWLSEVGKGNSAPLGLL